MVYMVSLELGVVWVGVGITGMSRQVMLPLEVLIVRRDIMYWRDPRLEVRVVTLARHAAR